MPGLSVPHLIVLALLVLVLFGRGRVSDFMGDVGKGIREFRRGTRGDAPGNRLPDPADRDRNPERDHRPDSPPR
jgi:sec-independent protein translocase protein TatA